VTVHQRRRGQPPLGIDDLRAVQIEVRADPGEPPAFDPHVDEPLADAYVANDEVHRVTVNR